MVGSRPDTRSGDGANGTPGSAAASAVVATITSSIESHESLGDLPYGPGEIKEAVELLIRQSLTEHGHVTDDTQQQVRRILKETCVPSEMRDQPDIVVIPADLVIGTVPTDPESAALNAEASQAVRELREKRARTSRRSSGLELELSLTWSKTGEPAYVGPQILEKLRKLDNFLVTCELGKDQLEINTEPIMEFTGKAGYEVVNFYRAIITQINEIAKQFHHPDDVDNVPVVTLAGIQPSKGGVGLEHDGLTPSIRYNQLYVGLLDDKNRRRDELPEFTIVGADGRTVSASITPEDGLVVKNGVLPTGRFQIPAVTNYLLK